MADDIDDLAGRLDRIEALLQRRVVPAPPPASTGPEVRSARSIVSRIDDVWVAVTEGNERVVAAIADLRRSPAAEEGAEQLDPAPEPADTASVEAALHRLAAQLDGIESALTGLAAADPTRADALAARLDGIEQRLAALALTESSTPGVGRLQGTEELLAAAAANEGFGRDAEDDAAVHLRLNRIEEGLAGIAGRLAEGAGAGAAAALAHLDTEVRGMSERMEALAEAVEAFAKRSGDGALTDRLLRLRDQFRR